ncbi:MAG: SPOR domain-containing protein [Halanaerobiales bacterium]
MTKKKNKSLTLVVIVMAVICLFVGYLVGVNLLQGMKGGDDQVAQTDNQEVEQDQIGTSEEEINSGLGDEDDTSPTEESETKDQSTPETQNGDYEDLFKIQVGAFSNKSNAESFQKELEDRGYDVIIKEAANFKVRVVGKETREETEEIEEELLELGYDTFIVK